MKTKKLLLTICMSIVILSSFLSVAEEVTTSRYDDELKELAEKMTRLIEKTESKVGKVEEEKVIEKGETPEDSQKIAEIERLEALLATKRETQKEIEREKQKIEREKQKIEEKKIALAEREERTKERAKDRELAQLTEYSWMRHKIQRQKIKMYAWTSGIIFISVSLAVLLALLLRKARKKIKLQKIFEQAQPGKDIFRAKKLRDVMKKKQNDKRKNLFDKDH